MTMRSACRLAAAVLLALPADGLPAGRPNRALEERGISVQALPALNNPAEVLECLRQHRLSPLACERTENTTLTPASPPPPPVTACYGEIADAACAHGMGRCSYDHVRGWHCACVVQRSRTRGLPDSLAERGAPDCIAPDSGVGRSG